MRNVDFVVQSSRKFLAIAQHLDCHSFHRPFATIVYRPINLQSHMLIHIMVQIFLRRDLLAGGTCAEVEALLCHMSDSTSWRLVSARPICMLLGCLYPTEYLTIAYKYAAKSE
jgi:hypothetical protein